MVLLLVAFVVIVLALLIKLIIQQDKISTQLKGVADTASAAKSSAANAERDARAAKDHVKAWDIES